MSERIKVFLVDDHKLFLSGVRSELQDRFDLVGEAEDVENAVAGITAAKPDVVLVDVHMPGGGGEAVIGAVAKADPSIRFLALSVSDAAEDVIAVIRAGARGYVTKSIAPADLADAIERVRGGDAVFSPQLAGFVLDASPARPRPSPTQSLISSHHASARSCVISRAATRTSRWRGSSASR